MVAAGRTAMTDAEPAGRVRGPTPLAVGVVVWLSSELMFFSALFAAWFTLRASTRPWPPAGVELATGRTALATVALIASSATMHRAVGAAERGDRSQSIRWLGVTALLGALFLVNLAMEYIEAPFRMSSHAYGSMFYLLTGFHGLHVVGGLLFMAAVASVVGGRGSRAQVAPNVQVCGYYWHFVDVVWIAMFSAVYLLQ